MSDRWAVHHGDFVGCELSAEYIEIARARIGHAAGQSRQKELALA